MPSEDQGFWLLDANVFLAAFRRLCSLHRGVDKVFLNTVYCGLCVLLCRLCTCGIDPNPCTVGFVFCFVLSAGIRCTRGFWEIVCVYCIFRHIQIWIFLFCTFRRCSVFCVFLYLFPLFFPLSIYFSPFNGLFSCCFLYVSLGNDECKFGPCLWKTMIFYTCKLSDPSLYYSLYFVWIFLNFSFKPDISYQLWG